MLFVFAIAFTTDAQTISFEKIVINVGKITTPTEVKYYFTNTGSQTLEISKVKSLIPDLVVSCPTMSVKPNARGYITVKIEGRLVSDGQPFSKPIIVTSNATNEPRMTLFVRGNGFVSKTITKKNGKYGVLGDDGGTYIPCVYDTIMSPINGYYIAKRNGKWGCVDNDNKIAISFDYDEMKNFDGYIVWARKGKKWGKVNIKNNVYSPGFVYDGINNIQEDVIDYMLYELLDD